MLMHEQRLVDAFRDHEPTNDLVGARVSVNAAAQGTITPRITITTSLSPDIGLAGNIMAYGMQASIQCWADNALQASQLADRAQEALITARYAPPSRVAGYDDELRLDAVVLTVEDWLDPDEITTADPIPS